MRPGPSSWSGNVVPCGPQPCRNGSLHTCATTRPYSPIDDHGAQPAVLVVLGDEHRGNTLSPQWRRDQMGREPAWRCPYWYPTEDLLKIGRDRWDGHGSAPGTNGRLSQAFRGRIDPQRITR